MRRLAITSLVFVFALVVIFLVNAAGTALLEAVVPGGLSTDRVPVTLTAQTMVAAVNFAAGAAGAAVVVLLAPNKPTAHALGFLGVVVLLDVAAAVVWWGLVPTWFTLAMVVLAPLQVWAGVQIGLRLRRRWRGMAAPAVADQAGA